MAKYLHSSSVSVEEHPLLYGAWNMTLQAGGGQVTMTHMLEEESRVEVSVHLSLGKTAVGETPAPRYLVLIFFFLFDADFIYLFIFICIHSWYIIVTFLLGKLAEVQFHFAVYIPPHSILPLSPHLFHLQSLPPHFLPFLLLMKVFIL